jgi:glycosyltransferase involved in cell wall biosynthesis
VGALDRKEPRRVRIGIDVRYLSHGLVGGVHTYVAQLIPALVEVAADHDLVLYADTKRPFELPDLPTCVELRLLPWHCALSSVYHDFYMRRVMARDRLDVVHFPGNYGFGPRGARTIVTLHDALNIMPLGEILFRSALRGHIKTLRSGVMTAYLHYCSIAALKRSDLILTVSEYARQDIIRRGRIGAERIVAVPHAPTPHLRRIDNPEVLADVRHRYGLTGPFVLADALKNPAVLLRAWQLLPERLRQTHRIVFFARRPDVLPTVREAVAAGYARLLIRPSAADLAVLYSLAAAFVYPSWIEGFGIPLLEAMTCGAPVVASDRSSIPEVTGEAALLADAEDAEGFAHHLTNVLSRPAEALRLRGLGYARAAQFSWSRTAQRTLDAFASVVAANSGSRG